MSSKGLEIIETKNLIAKKPFSTSTSWQKAKKEMQASINEVNWPKKSNGFTINPIKKENGVSPLTEQFEENINKKSNWKSTGQKHFKTIIDEYDINIDGLTNIVNDFDEAIKSPWFDAIKPVGDKLIAAEWETGNISSSHRSVNRLLLGLISGVVKGAVLAVPTRKLYQYMTDRIGNYQELKPYFPVWKNNKTSITTGAFTIYGMQHRETDSNVPIISKNNDGQAK